MLSDLLVQKNPAGAGYLLTGGENGQVLVKDDAVVPEGARWSDSVNEFSLDYITDPDITSPYVTVTFAPSA